MNAWHLLWIVPAAAILGFIWGAILAAGNDAPPQDNVDQDDSMCMQCPFRPSDNNEIT